MTAPAPPATDSGGSDRLIIAGGGVAGLATALALARHGHAPTLIEQNPDPAAPTHGYGLQLGAGAVSILRALGVHDTLKAIARPATHALLFSRDNRLRAKIPLPQPHWHLHRADLIAALKIAGRNRGVRLLPHQFTGLHRTPDALTLTLKDAPPLTAERLIAADGIHSPLRAALGLPAPPAAKTTAWRTLITDAPGLLPAETAAFVWGGGGRHLVAYRIRRATAPANTAINLVCVAPAADTLQTVLAVFGGWNASLNNLITAADADSWHASPLLHMPPVSPVQGRVIFVGDAAHPLPPHLARGAGLALEDALLLADCLHRPNPARALSRYARKRRRHARLIRYGAMAAGRLFAAGAFNTAALLARAGR